MNVLLTELFFMCRIRAAAADSASSRIARARPVRSRATLRRTGRRRIRSVVQRTEGERELGAEGDRVALAGENN